MPRLKLPCPETCPKCGAKQNEVIGTELRPRGGWRQRRRHCLVSTCGTRWSTYETVINPRHFEGVDDGP